MKSLLAALAVASAFLLPGCALMPETITASPTGGGFSITNDVVVNDLKSATYNLDQAVAIGVLDLNDPAPYCLHDVLKRAGIELAPGTMPPKTFQPKYDGLASAGAVAYIEAQKLKKLAGQGIQVDASCEALVGRIVIDGMKAARKAVTPSISGMLLK
jgi:hypothetical protein